MSVTHPVSVPEEVWLERLFETRPALAAGYASARNHARRHFAEGDINVWSQMSAALYQVNAGPRVLGALWSFEQRALPGTSLSTLVSAAAAVREICRHTGSSITVAAVASAEVQLNHGGDGLKVATYLMELAWLAGVAPDGVAPVVSCAPRLMKTLGAGGLRAWIEDGLRLYPHDRLRRNAYFRLEDPLSRRRLSVHEGAAHFAAHEDRLKLLTRALFAFDIDVRTVEPDDDKAGLKRSRLAGTILLMPSAFPGIKQGRAEGFFEAAVLHAAAHRRFTTERFAAGKLKPMQVALTALFEDARVERLAARAYPGLARLWLGFHDAAASRAQTVTSLFARLSRAIADPNFHDEDEWVAKGRVMFEAAFAADPERQSLSRDLANVLGHELGQLRIPFDGKSYCVQPAYRDDGLGLFDLANADPDTTEAIDILLEGARVEQEEQASGEHDPPLPDEPQTENARMFVAEPEDRGPVLATYPEFDHRLNVDQPDHVTVRDYPPDAAQDAVWLTEGLAANAGVAHRIEAVMRRARIDRATRMKRQIEGEEIDIEAAQEVMIARRVGDLPDPRIHSVKRRRGRDVALTVLLDTSASTGDATALGGDTILFSASLAVALLGSALIDLSDRFSVLAFSSNGREDVRISTIKGFSEDGASMVPRLASLKPGYSTRLGAAVRHAASVLGVQASYRKVLIIVTDGEPSDIDVEDASYLNLDAKRAVAEARTDGLDVFCVALGARAELAAAVIFGRRNTMSVERVSDLPQSLSNLYFRLTVS